MVALNCYYDIEVTSALLVGTVGTYRSGEEERGNPRRYCNCRIETQPDWLPKRYQCYCTVEVD